MIQERTTAGRLAAVIRGVKMGCKLELSPQRIVHACEFIEQCEHHDTVAQSLNVSRRTLYQALGTGINFDLCKQYVKLLVT